MSKTTVDDAGRAATRQSGKAVSLLARVILPRPGEPLDVRKLYLEENQFEARACE
jgi:galactofuranosylgalactofuranosylrhamnosyl-N-acetylglucosaminyl-diphospho-decaprenol beta-1,5/1,6-galactofuranosyltransferase